MDVLTIFAGVLLLLAIALLFSVIKIVPQGEPAIALGVRQGPRDRLVLGLVERPPAAAEALREPPKFLPLFPAVCSTDY